MIIAEISITQNLCDWLRLCFDPLVNEPLVVTCPAPEILVVTTLQGGEISVEERGTIEMLVTEHRVKPLGAPRVRILMTRDYDQGQWVLAWVSPWTHDIGGTWRESFDVPIHQIVKEAKHRLPSLLQWWPLDFEALERLPGEGQ